MRLTKIDPSNEPMRCIANDIALHYEKLLIGAVRETFGLKSSAFPSSNDCIALKCSHDCIVDPTTAQKSAPHFVADCVPLLNILTDAVTKSTYNDSQPQLYTVLAAIAKKELKRAQNDVKKRTNKVTKCQKKLKSLANNSGKSGTEAVEKANEALTNAKIAVIEAKSAAKQAEASLTDATERADESIKIQPDVIQCWRNALDNLTTGASYTVPSSVESCRILLPTGSKIGDQHQCTCEYEYVFTLMCFANSDILVKYILRPPFVAV